MSGTINDRFLLLIERCNIVELSKAGTTDYARWMNIKRGRARVGAEEIEILGNFFPQYRYWLISGEVMPEAGQTSPAYDEANEKLDEPNLA